MQADVVACGAVVTGELTVVLRDSRGRFKRRVKTSNLVVTAGKNVIADRMKSSPAKSAMSHMAVGSGTTAASAGQTALTTQTGSRKALTSTTVSGAKITYVASFNAGESTGTITEAGVFNASSSGDMLCRSVFTAITKGASDVLQITWEVTIQ